MHLGLLRELGLGRPQGSREARTRSRCLAGVWLVHLEQDLDDSLDVFVRREDAERFIEEVRGDDRELAKPLRIEEREFEDR